MQAAQQGAGSGQAALLRPLGFDLSADSRPGRARARHRVWRRAGHRRGRRRAAWQATLASPQLAGTIASTGGTLTYFDRAFRVQRASVAFDPADGVVPTIHAVGTTSVVNPDPDRARNPYGSAEITIDVDGQIEGLKIGFSTSTCRATRASKSSR